MRAHSLLITATLVIFLGAFPDIALAAAWKVVETTGTVRSERPASVAQPVSMQDELPEGSSLMTGGDGRAVLFNGEQRIVVGPNSRMTIPEETREGFTQILQSLGTLLFKVDKRNQAHFEVKTPMIAAVVKGTTFTVTSGAGENAVHVAEGLVEVSTLDGSDVVLVPAGATALVSPDVPSRIRVDAPANVDVDAAHRTASTSVPDSGADTQTAAIVAPIGTQSLDYGRLTNGLVQTAALPSGAMTAAATSSAASSPVEASQVSGGDLGSIATAGLGGSVGGEINSNTASVATVANIGAVGANAGGSVAASIGDSVGANAGGSVAASIGDTVGANAGGSVAANIGDTVGANAGGSVAANIGDTVGANAGGSVVADIGGTTNADINAGVAANLGDGNVSAGADVGGNVNSGGGGVDIGVGTDVAIDTGDDGVGVGAGVNVGGDDGIDVGVDVGLGGDDGISVGLNLGLGGGLLGL